MERQRNDGAWIAVLWVACALVACGDDTDEGDTSAVDTLSAMEVSTLAEVVQSPLDVHHAADVAGDVAANVAADVAAAPVDSWTTDASEGSDAAAVVSDVAAGVDSKPSPDVTGALSDVQAAGPGSDAGASTSLDQILRINHIQAKGTHNSYHLSSTASSFVPEWKFDQPPLDEQLDKHGVRQVELDVHYTGNGEFDVFHVPTIDAKSNCPTLRACLKLMKAWSDKHIKHHLLSILIEPKDDLDTKKIKGHYDELDAAILEVWPKDRVMRPDDVRGAHSTLRKALEADGWPTIAATRGKAMFLMLDEGGHRKAYLEGHPTLEKRVLFVRGGSTEPWAAAVELNDPVGSKTSIEMAAKSGFLVRSDADDAKKSKSDNFAKAKAALLTGAHHISSDFPVAPKGNSYGFVLSGGKPSRCNPVTAPPSCTSEAIESL